MQLNNRITHLLDVYTSKTATAEEEQELMEWIQEAQGDIELKAFMQEVWRKHQPDTEFPQVNWDAMFERVMKMDNVPVILPKRHKWWSQIAAAAVIILVASGAWMFFKKQHLPPQVSAIIQDVKAPAGNRATLTLATGQKVYLDSAANGQLAMQGDIALVKLADGQIAYQGQMGSATTVIYNTLNNPKSSTVINLLLPDGSRVWLNAGSSLTYPVVFFGHERKVIVNGEVYFEVAHNANMPFKVQKGEVEVTVLGTHFNVNAYDDEVAIKVTLLEGSVKVAKGAVTSFLTVGQQAKVADGIQVTRDIDQEEVMAWLHGEFQFGDRADIGTIMRQLARWYDIQIQYDGDVNTHIGGTITRSVNISQVLEMLEKTGAVKFEVAGKKVTVKPGH